MAYDCEKWLLKQFLDGIETNELFKIIRSIYHGGGISANTREDAELILLSQPTVRLLSNKKEQITMLLKFLISILYNNLIPTSDMTKADLCLAENTWKILNTNFMMKIMDMITARTT